MCINRNVSLEKCFYIEMWIEMCLDRNVYRLKCLSIEMFIDRNV